MTDPRLAALTEEVDRHWLESSVAQGFARCSCGEWRQDIPGGLTVPMLGEHFAPFSKHVAAAILAERGVFLPDGLTGEDLRRSDFFDEQAVALAALRAALDGLVDDFVDELPELPDDHIIEWETTLGALRRAAILGRYDHD